MNKKYLLTIRIELDPREARDDAEARQTATAQYVEMLGSHPIKGVSSKLQEIFPKKAPRRVRFNPVKTSTSSLIEDREWADQVKRDQPIKDK